MAMCRRYGWTRNLLVHQIDMGLHEKYAMNKTNFKALLPEEKQKRALLSVKDEYQFDFLELGEDYKERGLELALVKNIRRFLIEMGGYFTFIANQYRVEINNEEFFIDILLYHCKLKSIVAIELKAGKFQAPPEKYRSPVKAKNPNSTSGFFSFYILNICQLQYFP